MNRNGFFLIEFLVYLFIVLFLLIIVMRYCVASSYQLGIQSAYGQQVIQLYSVQARLTRDIEHACALRHYWLHNDNAALIWRSKEYDIGWFIEDEKLLRRSGMYNPEKGTWSKKKTNVGVVGILKGTFDISWVPCAGKQEQVACITIELEAKMPNGSMRTCTWCCMPRNREV